MTMLDDDRLRDLLQEAALRSDLPPDGPRRILDEARAATAARDRSARPGSLPRPSLPRGIRGRAALVAAAVLAVVGGVALLESPGGSPHLQSATGPSTPLPHARGGVTAGPVSGSRFGVAQGSASGGGSTGAAPGTSPGPLPTGVVGQPTKIETTGSVALAIGSGSLGAVVTHLTDLTTGAGGFVARSQLQVGPPSAGTSYGQLVLQVPQAQFAGLLAQVQKVAKATSVSSTSTDVTGQYVDLQARITALEASRQQYLTILSKATSIGDILSVQSQLDTIQSQIEQLQGQLNLLDSQTTFATLTVSLSAAGKPAPRPPGPRSGLSTAWSDAVGGFVAGVEWLVRIAGKTLFVLLLLAALLLLGRLAWREYRRRTL